MSTKGVVIHCEHCGSIISEREIVMYTTLVKALWQVFKWCRERNRHEFEMKDVRHLLNQVSYSNLNRWVFFGGLVYKNKSGHYGLNMERTDAFFRNKYAIPKSVWHNRVTKVNRPEGELFCKDVAKLTDFLNADGYYVASYREPTTLFQS